MKCIGFIILNMAVFLYSISIVGLNLESKIAFVCFVSITFLLFSENAPKNELIQALAAFCTVYYLLFYAAVLIINAKYQSETRNYINNHPEYVWSTIKEGVLNYFYL